VFSGPLSLRDRREHLSLVLTVIFALPVASVIGFVIRQEVGPPQIALFIVLTMLYLTLARGRLIGSSVMIHEGQYPRVFAIVKRACAALDIPMPLIFVREDYFVPAAARGFGEPYTLVLSSHWVHHFEDDELAFVIGRELGHIAAGHARYLTLLSVNGNENALVAFVFGAWLRSCDYTCDKVGLLVCGSLDAAARAIAVSSFHLFGRHVDMKQFAEQGSEIAKDSMLRWGEWLAPEPYATNRIAALRRFERTAQYAQLEEWLQRDVGEPPALPSQGDIRVGNADCAGLWRRVWALFIDAVVVSSLVLAFGGSQTLNAENVSVTSSHSGTNVAIGSDIKVHIAKPVSQRVVNVGGPVYRAIIGFLGDASGRAFLFLPTYLVVLVGFAGQSFGMMITGLRVVTTDFGRPGLFRALVRYVVLWVLGLPIFFLMPFMRRVMIHDYVSGTRLIRAESILARAATAPATATVS
jgi:Zn-dependent protease with chaperone function/uncharacterized RDD family membrane protein YckC